MKKVKFTSSINNSSVLVAEVKTTEKISIDAIECVFSDKVHSKVFLKDAGILRVRKSLNEWEQILPSKIFIRINRSAIINLNYVKKICKSGNQTLRISMQNYDTPLVMSRNYSTRLRGSIII